VKGSPRSIRKQSLIYFLIGMSLTLIISYIFSYFYMYAAVESLNEESIQSDFAQIDLGLEYLYNNNRRQLVTLATADFTAILLEHSSEMDVNLYLAISEFNHTIMEMIINFPYIHSVYLFLPDGRSFCVTKSNSRFFFNDNEPAPSEQIQRRVLSYAGFDFDYVGGLTSSDYPLPYPETVEQDLVSVVCRAKDARLVMNLYASQFEACYSGIASDVNSRIYLLKSEGEILSSLEKEHVGDPYAYYDLIQNAGSSSMMVENRQVIFRTNARLKYTIVFEVMTSEFINKFIDQERSMLVIIILGLLITCFFFNLWMKKALSPLQNFVQSMELAGKGHYENKLPEQGNQEIATLATNYNRMLESLQVLTRTKELAEKEKIEKELAILRYQMNPHFMYNTLNNIRWMAIIAGNEDISNSIKTLAEFLSPMFKDNSSFYTLKEEILSIDLYARIMNIRFGDGIQIQYDLDQNTQDLYVPRFILQPIIENCFTHAFIKTAQEGNVTIRSHRSEQGLEVQVEDNGAGLGPERIEHLNGILSQARSTRESG